MKHLGGRLYICAVTAVLQVETAKLNFLSAAIHPLVSNNYHVMVLCFAVLLRDLEAFLPYGTIVAFHFYLLTYLHSV